MFQGRLGWGTGPMAAGWVPVGRLQQRQHGRLHFRRDGRAGVVVEVDAGHQNTSTLSAATVAAASSSIVLRREPGITRSEENTSELQSLMRTSYAVLCLKKKKHK